MTDQERKGVAIIIATWAAFIVYLWLAALVLSVDENSWMAVPAFLTGVIFVVGAGITTAVVVENYL